MTELITLPFAIDHGVLERASQVKLVLFDVDGVLTDGRLIIGDDGQEYKAFHSQDGHGMKMLQQSGVEIGIITGRTSKVVDQRAANLGIKHVYQGCHDKLPVYEQLIAKLSLTPKQTAYVGDDVVDLPIMLNVGLAIAVQNAHYLTKQHAHWITPSAGGQGAAREISEMMLYAHDKLTEQMMKYLTS